MKKTLIFFLIPYLVGCQLHPRNKHLEAVQSLPAFTLISLDSSHLTKSTQLLSGKVNIFMYFNPDCEHCQHMTTVLTHHLQELDNVRLYMVTNEPADETKKFVQAFHLDSLSNVLVAKDYEYSFFDSFLPSGVPYFAIYDRHKRLRKIYQGEVDINSIIQSIAD